MRIGMKKTFDQHLLGIKFYQCFDQGFDLNIVLLERTLIVKPKPLFKTHHQRIITGDMLIYFGKTNV